MPREKHSILHLARNEIYLPGCIAEFLVLHIHQKCFCKIMYIFIFGATFVNRKEMPEHQ